MFNKIIIIVLVFFLILTGALYGYAFILTGKIDVLSERLRVYQTEQVAQINAVSAVNEEQTAQISALSDGVATFKEETLAGIDTLANEIRDVAAETISYGVRCQAYHNAPQTIPHCTFTTLNLNSERYDTDDMHSTSTNNSRVYC